VLTTLLGVAEQYRRPPDYLLFRSAIQKAWPELLLEPINPHATVSRFALRVNALKAVLKYWQFRFRQRKLNKRR
jgi:hypothetical protein